VIQLSWHPRGKWLKILITCSYAPTRHTWHLRTNAHACSCSLPLQVFTFSCLAVLLLRHCCSISILFQHTPLDYHPPRFFPSSPMTHLSFKSSVHSDAVGKVSTSFHHLKTEISSLANGLNSQVPLMEVCLASQLLSLMCFFAVFFQSLSLVFHRQLCEDGWMIQWYLAESELAKFWQKYFIYYVRVLCCKLFLLVLVIN
jgi:hypothetical protein